MVCKHLINLIAKNMVINKGNGNNGSFKIVEKTGDISKSTDVTNEENKNILTKQEKITTVSEDDSTLNALGSYIDDTFCVG